MDPRNLSEKEIMAIIAGTHDAMDEVIAKATEDRDVYEGRDTGAEESGSTTPGERTGLERPSRIASKPSPVNFVKSNELIEFNERYRGKRLLRSSRSASEKGADDLSGRVPLPGDREAGIQSSHGSSRGPTRGD